MEEAEPPECPVCLQPYDHVTAVPRVLTCGHTTCEACLKQLPNPFPNTLRCTVCTQLVKIPNCPSSLPKNLDLLQISSVLQRHATEDKPVVSRPSRESNVPFVPLIQKPWPYDFNCKWKKWVLHKDCILIEKSSIEDDEWILYGKVLKSFDSDYIVGCVLREDQNLGLVKVGIFIGEEISSKLFEYSYEYRIVSVLFDISESKRNELGLILNVSFGICNVGKVYGFWYNENDRCVYMVFQNFSSCNLLKNVVVSKEKSFNIDEITGFGMFGMEVCEIISRFHSRRVFIGCFGVNCFGFDEFGHVHVNLNEVLNMGRRLDMAIGKDGHKGLEISLGDNLMFISPEMLLHFLGKERFNFDSEKSRYEVAGSSDVWSLACLLIWLIIGSSFTEETKIYLQKVIINATSDEKDCDYRCLYASWMENIVNYLEGKLGLECVALKEILCRCLDFDPIHRPVVTELWKCMRNLVIKPQFDIGISLNHKVEKEFSGYCVILGELCQIFKENKKDSIENTNGTHVVRDEGIKVDVVEGVSTGHLKCIEMKGHLDCITGLAIGGGFLFSSSYDKMVSVWSLQDFTHVHTFKGHEHRVMAVVFVDGERPLCISGDNEGVICIWEGHFPFNEAPIQKLYEQKDWRYSGIHALAVSGTEYLYSGSGDRLVKAWSLKDYTISCSMSGHKSVVSSLLVTDGVLYSGSWDGTVRLWSISDHSPLAVLGEDKMGNLASVSSISAENNFLFAGHENGCIKIWHNDIFLKSTQTHNGAVFSVSKKGKWMFSGGWDKKIDVQEISEDEDDAMDATPVGSIACDSVAIALLYWQGKLFVGQSDRIIKVYYGV